MLGEFIEPVATKRTCLPLQGFRHGRGDRQMISDVQRGRLCNDSNLALKTSQLAANPIEMFVEAIFNRWSRIEKPLKGSL